MIAYVLITAGARQAKGLLERLRASKGIRSADAVAGPYDIIAVVEAETMNALGETITREIHNIDGVERTLTCIVLDI